MVDLISSYWVVLAIVAAIGAMTGFWILASRRHVELPRIEIGQTQTQTLARTGARDAGGGASPAIAYPPLPFEVYLDADVHPDDLLRIKGIGPKLARMLMEMGIVYYRQIAVWSATDIAAVDRRLGDFAGRITRDDWMEQARLLDAGDIAAYEMKFGRLIGSHL